MPRKIARPKRTQPVPGEAGLNFSGQRRSNNFVDAGRGSRFDINIETRPRTRVRRPPGSVVGAAVGRRNGPLIGVTP